MCPVKGAGWGIRTAAGGCITRRPRQVSCLDRALRASALDADWRPVMLSAGFSSKGCCLPGNDTARRSQGALRLRAKAHAKLKVSWMGPASASSAVGPDTFFGTRRHAFASARQPQVSRRSASTALSGSCRAALDRIPSRNAIEVKFQATSIGSTGNVHAQNTT